MLTETKLSRQSLALDRELDREYLATLWGLSVGTVLGHAFDGVLWGRLENGELRFASDANPEWGALFRADTLTDLRIFNREQELRVWRTDGGPRAARLTEQGGETVFARDQGYCLIHQPEALSKLRESEFVRMDGLAGQRHYPPGNPVPEKLWVRSYYSADVTGILRAFEHRALQLTGKEQSNA